MCQIRAGGVAWRWGGGGGLSEIPWKGVEQKRGETKIFEKAGGKSGRQGVGALKKGAGILGW